jgi:hypothetical protein
MMMCETSDVERIESELCWHKTNQIQQIGMITAQFFSGIPHPASEPDEERTCRGCA